MAEGPLQVELVAADRTVWSGEASMVVARTVDGDVGVLKDHAPLLSLLSQAVVEITAGDETVVATVDGGFISVAHNRVSILSERALLADEIDVAAAEAELEEARRSDDDDAPARVRLAEAQLRAVQRT
jgi:F-type H+-transporting ATPase subunit epsilon